MLTQLKAQLWPRGTKLRLTWPLWHEAVLVLGGICVGLGLYLSRIDAAVMLWAHDTFAPTHNLWTHVTLFGEGWFMALSCVVIGLIYAARKHAAKARLWVWTACLSIVAGGLVQVLLKIPFGRPRPKLYPLYHMQFFELAGAMRSFPSGHAFTVFILTGFMWASYPRLRWVLLVFSLVVAWSRIALSQHYLGDIVAGGCIGMGMGLWWHKLIPLEKK